MDENEEVNGENIKVTLLGNTGVGKTCIIKRFTEGKFEAVSSTSGASYSQKPLVIDNINVTLDLWDTAGQEKYRSLGRRLYKDAYIVVLVYDITDPKTFEDLKEKWYNDLKTYGEKYTVIGIVGNKSDCYDQEKVSEEEAKEFANKLGAIFMLTSAKTGENIDLLFENLTRKYLGPDFIKKVQEMKQDKGETTKITKESTAKNLKNKKCC